MCIARSALSFAALCIVLLASSVASAQLLGLPPRPGPSDAPVDVADNPNQAADPCAPGPAPATMVLCGTSTSHWLNGGFGLPGLQVWRDQAGQVHIRGSVTQSSGPLGGNLFVLPAELRPQRILGFPVLGEIAFRVDR